MDPARWLRTPSGADAVVVRIGKNGAQLVVVDAEGGWERWVYPSMGDAQTVADQLGIPVHLGAYPDAVRLRMNTRVRTRQELDRGAYREQGRVGPINPYPESRRRAPETRPPAS
jgi:hypothetical protein